MMKFWFLILPLAILAGGWIVVSKMNGGSSHTTIVTEQPRQTAKIPNPLATRTDDPASKRSVQQSNGLSAPTPSPAKTSNSALHNTMAVPRPDRNDIDLALMAVSPLTDKEFQQLEIKLRSDQTLLPDLLAEYRYNTDHERAKRLSALMARLDDPRIVQTAAELAYSGDLQSQRNGLELLSRLQPHNNEAREIAIGLLTSESNPEMLVATMNVLATPVAGASADHKQSILDNTTVLAAHTEPTVRAHSMILMGRWAKNDLAATDILTNGLSDNNALVRARATSALSGTTNMNRQVVNGLFSVLENPDEIKTTRQTAMLALQNITMPPQLQARFQKAQQSIRTRQTN